MAFTLTESMSFTGTTNTTTAHATIGGTNQLMLVSIAVGTGSANRVASITDSSSNTYTRLASDATTLLENELWYCLNGTYTNTTTLSVTCQTSDLFSGVWAIFSSGTTTNSFDRYASSTGTSATTASTSTAAATRNANEIIIGYAAQANNRPFNPGTGFTSVNQSANGTSAESFIEYQNVTSTGVQTATCSWDLSSTYLLGIATFSDTALPSVTTPHNLTLLGIGS